MLKISRKHTKWLWTAILVLGVAISCYGAWRSSAVQTCYANHHEYAAYQKQEDGAFPLKWVWRNAKVGTRCGTEFIHAYHEDLIAGGTVALAIFTTTLWWATRRLVGHATEIERAYVSGGAVIELEATGEVQSVLSSPHSYTIAPVTKPRWLVVTVDNYGKTPAYVSHIAWSVCPESELPKPAALTADYERSKMLVQMNVKPGAEGLQTRLRKEFSECMGKIVYGRFYYADIFGDLHSSGFILRVTTNNTVAIEAAPEYTAWD